MFMELTPAVGRAIEAARARAGAQSAEIPGSMHLLLALLDEPEGRPATLLAEHGLDAEATRLRLANLSRHWPTDSARIFLAASEIAVECSGERSVRSEHLLLAILRHDAGIRGHLERSGLDVAGLDAALRDGSEPALSLDEPLDLHDSVEQIDTARILDAAANRAREALRVIEDYCRFALDDAFLCREVKTLRHDLAAALDLADNLPLLAARDTLADVGTEIGTASESLRDSPLHVVRVNLKRLQEALRSLEEFGKVVGPNLGAALERLRYRVYTLERAIVLGIDVRGRLADTRLYLLVTSSLCATSLDFLIEEAAAGGVDIVQLREKDLSDRELLARARNVRLWTRKAGVLFIVNDRPDIARLAEADGVHLGQDDFPVREARRILGGDALIGVSTHSLEQVGQAVRDGASYIGVGPVFPSATKEFADFPGLDFIRQATSETTLPAFALGGITAENLPQVVAAGATRVAVSSALCSADEPRPVAQALSRLLGESNRPTNHEDPR